MSQAVLRQGKQKTNEEHISHIRLPLSYQMALSTDPELDGRLHMKYQPISIQAKICDMRDFAPLLAGIEETLTDDGKANSEDHHHPVS